jgi:predicted metal-dependent enzyme (double-stranded beta helix superfamily)
MTTTQRFDRHRAEAATSRPAFGELIASLDSRDLRAADPSEIQALLGDAALDDASLAPFVAFAPGRYTRNCVYRDDRFELLVLCWPGGICSPIHDHGESRCFMRVLRGSLTVETYSLVEQGREPGHARLTHAGTQVMLAGDSDALSPARDVHRVGAPDAAAISLHLYAKPLVQCLIYNLARESCRIAVNGYDSGPPERGAGAAA